MEGGAPKASKDPEDPVKKNLKKARKVLITSLVYAAGFDKPIEWFVNNQTRRVAPS